MLEDKRTQLLRVKKEKRKKEKKKNEVIEFANQYRMRAENQRQCKIRMNGQIKEEVNKFKYFGSIFCKYGRRDKRESHTRYESDCILGMIDERKDNK